MTFDLYHSYVIMNVTNRNQPLVKSEICHYFIIRLTIYLNEMKTSETTYINMPPLPTSDSSFCSMMSHSCQQKSKNAAQAHFKMLTIYFKWANRPNANSPIGSCRIWKYVHFEKWIHILDQSQALLQEI